MILSFDDNVPLQYQINMDFEVTNDLSRPTTAESENVTVKENITAGGVFKGQYEPYFTESSLVLVSLRNYMTNSYMSIPSAWMTVRL